MESQKKYYKIKMINYARKRRMRTKIKQVSTLKKKYHKTKRLKRKICSKLYNLKMKKRPKEIS